MKPTLQQEENLKAYLSNILKYRETIDEVYDHVLTAVEGRPENVWFQDAVNQVLNNDFGGGEGLVKMEKQYLRDASWEGYVKMFKSFKLNFQFPNIIYTLVFFYIINYSIQNIHINYTKAIIIFPCSALFFLLLGFIRKFFIGYFTGDKRKSISDVVIDKILFGLNGLLLYPFILVPHYKKQYQELVAQHLSVLAGVITMFMILIIAVIKISLEEFRTYKTV